MFKCVCMLSVNIRYHEVHRTADGNQVGYLPAPTHGVHGMHQGQPRASVMQTVRRLVPRLMRNTPNSPRLASTEAVNTPSGNLRMGFVFTRNSPSGTLSINCSIILQDSMISSMRTI